MALVTQVSVKKGAGYNLVPVAQFLAMPINERLQLVFSQSVEFLDSMGNVVPLNEALDQVAEMAVRKAAGK